MCITKHANSAPSGKQLIFSSRAVSNKAKIEFACGIEGSEIFMSPAKIASKIHGGVAKKIWGSGEGPGAPDYRIAMRSPGVQAVAEDRFPQVHGHLHVISGGPIRHRRAGEPTLNRLAVGDNFHGVLGLGPAAQLLDIQAVPSGAFNKDCVEVLF